MTRKLMTYIALAVALSGAMAANKNKDIKQLYQTLDSLIECQPDIIAEKKERIKAIVDGMASLNLSAEQQHNAYTRLYDEYLAFQFDSALHYISKNVELQRSLNNPDLSADNLIRMSHILAASGLFDKAQKALDSISKGSLTTKRKVEYYNQRGELNLYRSEMAQFSPFFQDYIDSAQYYRQLVIQIAPKTSYDYIFNQATYCSEQGDVEKSILLLEKLLESQQQGERRFSIVTSTLAFFYSQKNDEKMQEYYLLLSAISDLKGAILENNSLRELASILMMRGEYKKAYDYLSQASLDAQTYGSRLRSLQAARLTPLIAQAYNLERTHAEHKTRLLLGVISVIALILVATMIYTLSLVKKRRLANEEISKMNKKLSSHNTEIQAMNCQMKESNRIKDEYIGRFLELSSNLIYRGEQRAKLLNRLARERKIEELYSELKNLQPINEGIRLFHQNFDTAFLNIYPNFIEEVNKLMTEDNWFEVSDDTKRLTTELRVLALIRLGISDNQKIADILRSSITTIYTYRSKLKSRAHSKETFEDDIRKASTF